MASFRATIGAVVSIFAVAPAAGQYVPKPTCGAQVCILKSTTSEFFQRGGESRRLGLVFPKRTAERPVTPIFTCTETSLKSVIDWDMTISMPGRVRSKLTDKAKIIVEELVKGDRPVMEFEFSIDPENVSVGLDFTYKFNEFVAKNYIADRAVLYIAREEIELPFAPLAQALVDAQQWCLLK